MKTIVAAVLLCVFFNARPALADCQSEMTEHNSKGILLELEPQLENIGLAIGEAAWTADHEFEGNIIIFQANGQLSSRQSDSFDENGYQTQYYMGVFESDTQFGEDGLEYQYLRVSAISHQKVRQLEKGEGFQIIKKGIDYGNVQISKDLALGQEAYLEIAPVKVYGTIGWSPKALPDLELLAEASVSVGYARARSTRPHLDDASDFYMGRHFGLTAKYGRFGQVDFSYEVEGDQDKYDPHRVGTREAKVQLGYTYPINNRVSITAGLDKRSFSMGNTNGVGQGYEKSKRFFLAFRVGLK